MQRGVIVCFLFAGISWIASPRAVAAPRPPSIALPADAASAPDYRASIELWERLIQRFPDDPRADAARYLLGFALGRMGREDEARRAFRSLVCPRAATPAPDDPYAGCAPLRPASPFLAEAWMRLGESHFDAGEHAAARAAYARVLQHPDSPYYDKALYKLAWSHYLVDHLAEAARGFDALVQWADAHRAGSELRSEAIRYIAVALAEPSWDPAEESRHLRICTRCPLERDPDSEALRRAEAFYRGRDGAPYVREVFRALGDVLYEGTDYAAARLAYRRCLDRWPEAAEAPAVHERLIAACVGLRDDACVTRESRAFADAYGTPGTRWTRANAADAERIADAVDRSRRALLRLAASRHKLGQRERAAGGSDIPSEAARARYEEAAAAYRDLLLRYPDSREALDAQLAYAEALFYAGRFDEAAAQYARVRDGGDPRDLEAAAFGAVKAREAALVRAVAAGRAVLPPLPEAVPAKTPIAPRPLAPEAERLRDALDAYVIRLPAAPRAATLACKAAELCYRHLDLAAARARFEGILRTRCADPVAVEAGRALVASWVIAGDEDRVVEWTSRLAADRCLAPPAAAAVAQRIAEARDEMTLAAARARFTRAEKLLAAGRNEEAAAAFLALADADRAGLADKAIANAALALDRAGRAAAAAPLYLRLADEHPASPLAAESLLHAGLAFQKSLAFDRALAAFTRLADDPRLAATAHRSPALYDAGVLLERNEDFAAAARRFEAFARTPSALPAEAAEAWLRAAAAHLRLRDGHAAVASLRAALHARDLPLILVIEARARLAEAHDLLGDRDAALAERRRLAALAASVAPGSEAAERVAEARFRLAEARLAEVERLRVEGGGERLARSIERLKREVAGAVADFDQVIALRRARWTLAAYFRTGYCFELLARALLAAPCPPEIHRLGAEACDLYRVRVEGELLPPIEAEALRRYEVTLQQAGRLGVANEWTHLAGVHAHEYDPARFPIVHDARADLQLEEPTR